MSDESADTADVRMATVVVWLAGMDLDPAKITAATGLRPTSTREPAAGLWDVDGTWLDDDLPGHWWFSTDSVVPPGATLNDHLYALFGDHPPTDENAWQRITQGYRVEVRICIQCEADQLPPRPDTVLALATPVFRTALERVPGALAFIGVDNTAWRHPDSPSSGSAT